MLLTKPFTNAVCATPPTMLCSVMCPKRKYPIPNVPSSSAVNSSADSASWLCSLVSLSNEVRGFIKIFRFFWERSALWRQVTCSITRIVSLLIFSAMAGQLITNLLYLPRRPSRIILRLSGTLFNYLLTFLRNFLISPRLALSVATRSARIVWFAASLCSEAWLCWFALCSWFEFSWGLLS